MLENIKFCIIFACAIFALHKIEAVVQDAEQQQQLLEQQQQLLEQSKQQSQQLQQLQQQLQPQQQQQQHQQHSQQQQQPILTCWHCSSDTVGAEDFCGVSFAEKNIPSDLLKERNINVERKCNSTINSELERPVCRKTVEELGDGKTVTKRFCYYTNVSDDLRNCNATSMDKDVHRVFCEDCLTDKCNAAGERVLMFGSMMLPILLIQLNLFA